MTKLDRRFQQLDKFRSQPFMPDGRRQPKTPTRKILWIARSAHASTTSPLLSTTYPHIIPPITA